MAHNAALKAPRKPFPGNLKPLTERLELRRTKQNKYKVNFILNFAVHVKSRKVKMNLIVVWSDERQFIVKFY